jgi:hypothetical protein
MSKGITITLTENQADIILRALSNESMNDRVEWFGEYSYWRCHQDIQRKIEKALAANNK